MKENEGNVLSADLHETSSKEVRTVRNPGTSGTQTVKTWVHITGVSSPFEFSSLRPRDSKNYHWLTWNCSHR